MTKHLAKPIRAFHFLVLAFLMTIGTQIKARETFIVDGQKYSFQTFGEYCVPDAYPEVKQIINDVKRAAINANVEPNIVHMMRCADPTYDGDVLIFPTLWIRRVDKTWPINWSDEKLQSMAKNSLAQEIPAMSNDDIGKVLSKITNSLKAETSVQLTDMSSFIFSNKPFSFAQIIKSEALGKQYIQFNLATVRAVNNELFFIYVSQPLGNYGFSDFDYEKALIQISNSIRLK
jgi:hypothetical protein